jgi:hypothetical protein
MVSPDNPSTDPQLHIPLQEHYEIPISLNMYVKKFWKDTNRISVIKIVTKSILTYEAETW